MNPDVPDKVGELAGSDSVELIWRNELGGLTFRADGHTATRYIKWQQYTGLNAEQRADVDLMVESAKLRWAGRFTRVPRVIEAGQRPDCAWLVTEGLDGVSAVDPGWHEEPETAVRAIATGLRRMHDALPVDSCPYRGTWSEPHRAMLPAPERLVVCHGDPCMPNTLMNEAGEFVGHVDMARLGVADRWADLAIATYSISWDFNLGRSFDELFLETYGAQPDHERIRIYRELWDAH